MTAIRNVRDLAAEADLGLSQYQLADWFESCVLKGDALLVPTRKAGEDIARLFGLKLRRVLPHLKILVQPPKPEPVKSPLLKKNAPQELHDLWGPKQPRYRSAAERNDD